MKISDGSLVLVPAAFGGIEREEIGLPPSEKNLFSRLIRNPNPFGRVPRERECTEMLCSVLLHAPSVRDGLLAWMAKRAGQAVDLKLLRISAETEQNALGKRDDLRIEGTNDERDTTELLWTIEVKVGSGFHSSSDLQDPTSESDAHQIRNYDDWLSQQTATFRAGFVLARTDVKEDIPPDLRMPWTCLRWAELAQIVEHLLRGGELPPVETFLASHFVGFVRDALWQEVPDAMDRTIDFDDIALMRAVFMLGDRCRARVDALVSPLVQELKDAGLSQGGTGHQSKLFEPSKRNVVWQSLGGPGSIRPPYIYAGVVSERGADVAVWLETTSTFELKPKIRSLVQEKLPDLQRRNPNWHFLEPDESNSWELELRIPIESLLAEKEPGSRVTQFVRSAFTDLKETGLMNAIQATLSAPQ